MVDHIEGELAQIGEVVWGRLPGERRLKAEAQWRKGIWLGKTDRSDEHLVADPGSTKRYRVIRRRPVGERYDPRLFNTFAGLPWDLQAKPRRGDPAGPHPWGGAEPHYGDAAARARDHGPQDARRVGGRRATEPAHVASHRTRILRFRQKV